MKNNNTTYNKDFKIAALSLLSAIGNVSKVAEELKVSCRLLKTWKKEHHEFGDGSFPGFGNRRLNPEDKKIHELEKKLEISNLHFRILKSAGKILYMGRVMIFYFVLENENKYSIGMMCSVLCINRNSYQHWKTQSLSETQKRKVLIQQEITAIFFNAKSRYGSKRIRAVLKNSGYHISDSTVKKYMNEMGLSSKLKGSTKKILTYN
jgi:hypothetical protein